MTAGGYRYFLAYDQVGSLRLVVNGAGSVVKSIQYDSFGNILEETNPAFAIPLGFAGGLHDRDTSLVRFGYRDYDPDVGRWTAKDPIGFAGGDTDLYSYVLNDPLNEFDPYGLQTGAPSIPGFPGVPPILPPVFYPGTPENNLLVRDLNRILGWLFDGPKDPTNPKEWQQWAEDHDIKVSLDTCSETHTPWQGPGKKFDPNEPPDGPWWKKALWAAGQIIKLIKGWPH
jgi:RHS repeat-associated protein